MGGKGELVGVGTDLVTLGDKTYKSIGIVRPVEEDAIDGFLGCENTDRGGSVAGCDCWILCFFFFC